MALEGYVEYKKREYCRVVQCPVQLLLDEAENGSGQYEKIRKICQVGCLQTSHGFHKWLIEEGYIIVKPEK